MPSGQRGSQLGWNGKPPPSYSCTTDTHSLINGETQSKNIRFGQMTVIIIQNLLWQISAIALLKISSCVEMGHVTKVAYKTQATIFSSSLRVNTITVTSVKFWTPILAIKERVARGNIAEAGPVGVTQKWPTCKVTRNHGHRAITRRNRTKPGDYSQRLTDLVGDSVRELTITAVLFDTAFWWLNHLWVILYEDIAYET